MKKFLALAIILLSGIVADCSAGDNSYKNSPEYQKMDNQMRTDLQNCLSDNKLSTKDCMKHIKEKYKEQKKEIKKQYKHNKENPTQ